MGFDDRPANGGKRDQSYLPARQVLFVVQLSITGYQNVETAGVRNVRKLAMFQTGPGSSERLVLKKMLPQTVRKVFIEQHLHGVN